VILIITCNFGLCLVNLICACLKFVEFCFVVLSMADTSCVFERLNI
jgi:hypothetical protein